MKRCFTCLLTLFHLNLSLSLSLISAAASAATDQGVSQQARPLANPSQIAIGQLTQPISNNAVAAVKLNSGWQLYSFNGLASSKDQQGVTNLALGFKLNSRQPFTIKVPYQEGRLASIAVTVKGQIYLFGGYTVGADEQEKSMTDVYRFDPNSQQFSLFSTMPIAVDDTAAVVYQDRYIYLISGWHDVGNVSAVQVLDTQTQQWFFATPYPGVPVFGHAAGIVGNTLVVADGVKVAAISTRNGKQRRDYQMSPASYFGTINPQDFSQIQWQKLPAHPGVGKYRMAATGVTEKQWIIFAAGSDNPYNYNGIGYNGNASEPSNAIFAYDIRQKGWINLPPLTYPTMDHRGLLAVDGQLYLLGGMLKNQQVSDKILSYPLP